MKNRVFIVFLFVIILGVILFFLFYKKDSNRTDTPVNNLPRTSSISDSAKIDANRGSESVGSILYNKNCAVCHQTDGKGDGMRFPSLEGSEWVTGDKSRLIGVVLNGLQGEIEVNGEEWNGVMPALGPALNDGEIAAVLTYVRQGFGNKSSTVDSKEVAKVRNNNDSKE